MANSLIWAASRSTPKKVLDFMSKVKVGDTITVGTRKFKITSIVNRSFYGYEVNEKT